MSETRKEETPGFVYRRDEPFSYACNRCKRCCYGKRISLSPYDLIRLAEVLEITTGELIEQHTIDGIHLKVRNDAEGEPCVFLGEEGCTVHAGRPGACRVYPLGRSATIEGEESFAMVEPHPQTAGVYGVDGTIDSFVRAQEAEPYFDASKRYLKLFAKLAVSGVFEAAEDEASSPTEAHVLDVDATVERYCRDRALPFPKSATEKMLLHIEAIEASIDAKASG